MFHQKGRLLQLFHFGIFGSPCPLAAGRSSRVATGSPTQGFRPSTIVAHPEVCTLKYSIH